MKREELMRKMAQAGLSEEDRGALMGFLAKQKEEEAKKELQKKNLRAQNRADRVSNAKLALTVIMGAAGGLIGNHFGGKYVGGVGALGGGIGGYLLGDYLGNRKADKMEEEEDRTGVSVFDQNHRNMSRQLNNWYMWDRHGPAGLGYSLLTR